MLFAIAMASGVACGPVDVPELSRELPVLASPLAGRDGALTVSAPDTQLNLYAVLAADVSPGGTSISVTNIDDLTAAPADPLAAGDLVMIIQMQGATIDTSDAATYGTVTGYNSAGLYEIVEVASVTGNTIDLIASAPLHNSYTTAGHTQVIRVPQYTTLTVDNNGQVGAPAWDGARGGVIVLYASTAMTLNGFLAGTVRLPVDASGIGFRGGAYHSSTGTSNDIALYATTDNQLGAAKGESIAGFTAEYAAAGRYGRGAPANGGGGGNSHNGGGGGGANATSGQVWTGAGVMSPIFAAAWALDPYVIANNNQLASSAGGGRGGYTWSGQNLDPTVTAPGDAGWGGNNRREHGGLGGRPVAVDATRRLTFGGGGGAGDRNNANQVSGGAGGGIVILIAPSITGDVASVVRADGQTGGIATQVPGDAPGGGGGGGTIVVATSALTNIALQANGGDGGSQYYSDTLEAEGSGGGGGGGYVAFSGGAPTVSAAGGKSGATVSSPTLIRAKFGPNGATDGAGGVANGVVTTLPLYVDDASKNDAPVNRVPGPLVALKNTALTLSAANASLVSIADPDAGSGIMSVTIAVTNGTVTIGNSGLTSLVGNGTSNVTLTGTITAIDASLALGITFTPESDFVGSATVTLTTDDQGNSGAGGAKTDVDAVTITVIDTGTSTANNDPPVNRVPGAQTLNEDVALVFSASNGNVVSTYDPDALATDTLQATLSVTAASGSLTLSRMVGLTFTTGDGLADQSMTFSGTLADLNAALEGLAYMPATNYSGTTTLTLTVSDLGHTGPGGTLTDTDSVTITVSATNDPPVNSLPASGTLTTTPMNTTLTFSAGNNNRVQTRDADVLAADLMRVVISVTAGTGTLTLGSTTGLAFSVGDGTTDQTMTFTGTLTNVNNALNNLRYIPATNYVGSSTLTLSVDDQGHTGAGGNKSDVDAVTLWVNGGVNDAPINTVPGAQTIARDSRLVFSVANGNPVSVFDIDAGNNAISVQLSLPASTGVLTLPQLTGLTVTAGANGSETMTVSGSLTDLNAALSALRYDPPANWSGSTTFTILTNDLGRTGTGGAKTDTDTVAINVTATLNRPPVNTVPGPQTFLEEGSLVFSAASANLITTTDPDALATSLMAVTLSVSAGSGTLTLSQVSGLTFTSGANGQTSMSFTGTLADVNAALSGMTYAAATSFFGTSTLIITVNDQGATGLGVPRSDSDSVTLTVTGVNDVPSFTKGADQSVLEDAGAQAVAGWATAITAGPGETQTLDFIVSNNNSGLFAVPPFIAANGTLTYTPAANASGTATVTVQLHDDGGTANGGVDTSAAQTFTITVTAVNDAPSFTKGADESVLEDTGAHTGAGWATALSAGPSETQTLDFIVSNNNSGLFTVQPAIAANGTLTYTLAANAFGVATVTVRIHDNGGTANGGIDTSAAQTFTITVTGINDVPGFTKGADESVLEDTGAHTIAGWATAISAGPGETQTLDFIVSNDNSGLFAVPPAIAANGTLTYTLAANASGAATVTVQLHDNGGTASGGVDTSAAQTCTITVTAVNDAPSFTKGADESVLEDTGAHTVAGWATALSAGPSETQTLDFIVSNNNSGLFAVQPAIAANGTLTYTLAANAFGAATVTIRIHDNGGTANGGVDTSAAQTFTITVTGINDAPSFTKGSDQSVFEDAGAQTIAGWATAIAAGPGETQALDFIVSNDNNGLFSVQPAIAANGTLTYTLAANAFGAATVTAQIHDNGGTANGGVDTSAAQTFAITVTGVNDAPSFTNGSDQSVFEDAGEQTVVGWATALSAGPGETQTLTFVVSNDANALFAVQPAIAADGTLTYTPAADTSGTATVTVQLQDDGGTADGGVDTSAAQTFTITVTAVNDAPSFTKGGDESVLEDAGAQSVTGWASAMAAGPADELAQALEFIVSNDNASLFTAAPAIAVDGTLSYTPADDAFGVANVSVQLRDDGGTASGGIDTSAVQTFTITVMAVNDAPSFAKGGDQTVLEDAGAQTIAAWATSISAGPGETQTLDFIVSNDNNALFAAPPAVAADGTLTFTPTTNADGSATVTVQLHDDGGTANGGVDTSAAQTFSITVVAVNDAPSFVKGSDQSVLEDAGAQTVAGWATAISAGPGETQAVDFIVTNDNGALFSAPPAIAADGTLTYTPAADAHGSATVTVQLHDDGGTAGGGADTNAAVTFTITVTPVNDAPVAVSEAYSVDEDTTLDVDAPGVLDNDTDVDGQALQAVLVASPASGSLTLNADGSFRYVPAANFHGDVTFTYAASDGVAQSAAVTVTLTVRSVNDAPVAVDDLAGADNAATDIDVLANDYDADGDTLTVTSLGACDQGGSVSINADGTVHYVPQPAFVGTETFTYVVSDASGATDEGLVTVSVNNTNDPPVLTLPSEPTIAEDTSFTFTVADGTAIEIADPDAGTSDVQVTIAATHATVTLATISDLTLTAGTGSGDATVTFTGAITAINTALRGLVLTPAADFNGTVALTVTANDLGHSGLGGPTETTTTLEVTVTAVNDAPVALADTAASVGLPVTIAPLANDSDVDGDLLAIAAVTQGTAGVVSITGEAGISYVPQPGFDGVDSFTYTVSDPGGLTATATVNVTVDIHVDSDGDGVPDVTEVGAGTDPYSADTDGDGLSDGTELNVTRTDPLRDDTDNDGLADRAEDANGDGIVDPGETDPRAADTDGDGLSDGTELGLTTPAARDTDLAVFVPDADPTTTTDPSDDDTDDDGILDGNEDEDHNGRVDAGETDPLSFDTDGDGLADGTEIGLTAPQGSDTDASAFIPDADPTTTTDPLAADTDGAGASDGAEDASHNGQVDAGETDPNDPNDDVDADHDGVTNDVELAAGTDPFDADSDDDGLTDGADGLTDTDGDGRIDALDPDSDDDGILDGTEAGVTAESAPADTDQTSPNFEPDADPSTTTDPKNPDSDGDEVVDGAEDSNGNGRVDPGESDPNNPDSDGAGATDGEEKDQGTDPTNPLDDYVLAGSGCAAASGHGSLAGLLTAAMTLVLAARLRRRRGRKVAGHAAALLLLLAHALWAAPAHAAGVSPSVSVQRLQPAGGTYDLLGVSSATVAPHLSYSFMLMANYGDAPLRLLEPATGETHGELVSRQLTLDLGGALALFDRFEVAIALPVTVNQSSSGQGGAVLGDNQLSSAGVGDLRLTPKAALVSFGDLSFAAALPITIPTGNSTAFLGDGGVTVAPRLLAELRLPFRARALASLGVLWRESKPMMNLDVGSAFTYGVGGELPLSLAQGELSVVSTLVGEVGLKDSGATQDPLELLVGARFRLPLGLSVGLAGGPGLTQGYGTPRYRVVATVGYTSRQPPAAVTPPPTVAKPEPPSPPPPPPLLARDDASELLSGSTLVMRVLDNDEGRPGAALAIAMVSQPSAGAVTINDDNTLQYTAKPGFVGRDTFTYTVTDGPARSAVGQVTIELKAPPPPPDRDEDGNPDAADKCPDIPEDKDSFEDEDGCPDSDHDHDGIEDTVDRCPTEPETINGYQDEDGCPDKGAPKVVVEKNRIVILDKVYFDTGKDTIMEKSFSILKQVALVLKASPQIAKLRVEGHTDSQGDAAANQDLSERRAKAVVAFLVQEGVEAARLEGVGFGLTKPIASNSTSAGRATNRRVEFIIVDDGTQGAPDPAAPAP